MINRECLKKLATKKGYTYNEESNYLRMVFPKDGTKKDLWYFYDNGQWVLVESDGRNPKAMSTGKWQCNGNENFKIIIKNYTYDGDTDAWVESTTEPVSDEESTYSIQFSCIQKNKGNAAKIDSNGDYVWFWVDEPNKVAHIFFKDGKWSQTKNNTNQFTGRWNCDEDSHFLIVSDDGQSYSSRSDNWEKVTTVGNLNDSFPLKFESQGPNVVKLQKFLNDKIRTNPLTVNGIFDQKTQDKLIEFQKKEGIIE
jgi:hypothetical protein